MLFSQAIDLIGFEQYLEHRNKAPGTIANYLYELKKLQKAPHKKNYLADNKNKFMLIFSWRNYLKYLRSVGKITPEELAMQLDIYRPPLKRGTIQNHTWYPEHDWKQIIERLPHRVGKMCVYIQLNFGVRIGELVHLRKDLDIDFETQHIHIQARPGWKPKHAHERSIPGTKAQLRVIKRWMKNIPQHISHNYLLFNTWGNKLTVRTVQKWYSKAHIQSHDLRRSYAKVIYYKSDKDVKFVSALLGHTNISTTSAYLGLEAEEIQTKYMRIMT